MKTSKHRPGRTFKALSRALVLVAESAKAAELAEVERLRLELHAPSTEALPLADVLGLAMSKRPPAVQALRAILEHLPRRTLIKLVVLMYAGRGDGDFARGSRRYFERQFEEAGEMDGPAYRLASKSAALGEYLIAGLERAEREGFDVERERWP